jgi:hypothetical protein
VNGASTVAERPLLDGILEATFTLDFDVGPTLITATLDLTIQPQGSQYSTFDAEAGAWTVMKYDANRRMYVEQKMATVDATTDTIRLVASTGPRSGAN